MGTLMFMGLLSMAIIPLIPTARAAVDTSSHNNIVVDGVIGTDWTDGNYTVRLDPDLAWDGNWGLEGLYFALNDTGIFVALQSTMAGSGDNQFNVFIDTDKGGNGLVDYELAGIASGRKAIFASGGFTPDFVLRGTGEENFTIPWKLYSFDDAEGTTTDLTAAAGYDAALLNDTTFDGTWTYPIGVVFEAFIPWDVLYSAGIPADAELRFFAAMIGGEPGDVIPNQYLDVDSTNVAYSNYVAVKVADADGDPQLLPYYVGWFGADPYGYTSASVNEVEGGGVTLALDMVITYEMWYQDSVHDYMNTTEWPMLYLTHYNSTLGANETESVIQMYHQAGYTAGNGNNELFHYVLPLIPDNGYAVDDIFYWYVLAGDLNTSSAAHFENTIVPMPPIDIGFVGNVYPIGGFQYPDQDFTVTVQLEQLWNGSTDDPVAFDLGTMVTLNYTLNETGTWDTYTMAWESEQGRNAQYAYAVPGLPVNTTFKYHIIVENNNTVITDDYSVLILVPPPEDEIFYMTDPAGDEWGTYPTNAAFGGLTEGLFDILNFNVSSNIYGTTFTIELADTYDPDWGAGNFSHQLFVVMIDTEAGGATDGVLRSYVTVEEAHAWDHAFYVDGWIQRYFTPTTIDDPQTAALGITTNYEQIDGKYMYSFNVPETLFGEVATADWSYYLMSSSADFNDFRNHMAENGEWNFGGGDDGDADPNFCDTIVPAGGDSAAVQNTIASGYDTATSTRATLLASGPGITFVGDTTDPVVAITAPVDGANYSWTEGDSYTIDLTWTAEDPADATFSGLADVNVYVNGVLVVGATEGAATITLDVGANVIRVVAEDKSGNTALAEITVNLADDRTTEPPEEDPIIPGFTLGFLLLAGTGAIFVMMKKFRK